MTNPQRKIPTYEDYLEEARKIQEEDDARAAKSQSNPFDVYHGGPKAGKAGAQGSLGWNVGDIDFDPDGSIFIRNPYLANAIEACIAKNHETWFGQGSRADRDALLQNGRVPFLFRLTRDEGWSGEKQNIVC